MEYNTEIGHETPAIQAEHSFANPSALVNMTVDRTRASDALP
jgi:hypothetical protein